MSAAEPIGDERRLWNYLAQRGRTLGHGGPLVLTPAQWRRVNHKQRRGAHGYGYPGTKGYATPRQRRQEVPAS